MESVWGVGGCECSNVSHMSALKYLAKKTRFKCTFVRMGNCIAAERRFETVKKSFKAVSFNTQIKNKISVAKQGDQGPMLCFLKYFRRKNWHFLLKTKLKYAKLWS
jgi:hypothetical protein